MQQEPVVAVKVKQQKLEQLAHARRTGPSANADELDGSDSVRRDFRASSDVRRRVAEAGRQVQRDIGADGGRERRRRTWNERCALAGGRRGDGHVVVRIVVVVFQRAGRVLEKPVAARVLSQHAWRRRRRRSRLTQKLARTMPTSRLA